ncbi:MAG: hypothetical protein RTU92_00980 [Candidatus Thorarchaeota archaeon]
MANADMTHAKVLKIVSGNVITLPTEFVEGIGQPFGLAIMVLKDRNVKLYPVDSEEVYYLRLEIDKLSKSFLEELTLIFEEAGLEDILFTSGICQAADKCFYECYFTPQQLSKSVDDINESLNEITGVRKVVLEQVSVS